MRASRQTSGSSPSRQLAAKHGGIHVLLPLRRLRACRGLAVLTFHRFSEVAGFFPAYFEFKRQLPGLCLLTLRRGV